MVQGNVSSIYSLDRAAKAIRRSPLDLDKTETLPTSILDLFEHLAVVDWYCVGSVSLVCIPSSTGEAKVLSCLSNITLRG
jgi:hypothetical protein